MLQGICQITLRKLLNASKTKYEKEGEKMNIQRIVKKKEKKSIKAIVTFQISFLSFLNQNN